MMFTKYVSTLSVFLVCKHLFVVAQCKYDFCIGEFSRVGTIFWVWGEGVGGIFRII